MHMQATGGAVGGTVNVNGNVDISGVGNGLFANIGGATINVNGGKINIVDTDKKNGYSAIYATCGAINMNTVKDAAGKVIGAGNNKVDITGNVVVSVGAVNYVDCCTETEVNLGLTTKDSKLTGVVYNQFPEAARPYLKGVTARPLPALPTCGCRMVQPGPTSSRVNYRAFGAAKSSRAAVLISWQAVQTQQLQALSIKKTATT